MNRRDFTFGMCGCAALALSGCANQQPSGGQHILPAGYRPGPQDADEAGLWHTMERAEANMKTSPLVLRDPALNAYVRDITCRLVTEHCQDVRVYILRNPYFNATMAPNGMMQVWTGLLLRCHNEAQLAAVIGHEIGHYLRRHSVQRWRDVRQKADFAVFLNMGLGLAGAGAAGDLANLILLASIFGFSREQEREADRIGFELMADAGYSAIEPANVWEQLIKEDNAAELKREPDIFFASHPEPAERAATLKAAAAARPATGAAQRERYVARVGGLRPALLADQMRLRRYGRSEALLDMLIADAQAHDNRDLGLLLFSKGEVYRQRARQDDPPKARKAYETAISAGDAPPETYRSIGLLHRSAGESTAAAQHFRHYLSLRPDAADREMIQSYIGGGN